MPGPNRPLSATALELLKSLWELGPCTVRQLNESLRKRRKRWAYTTVQTVLNTLERKGKVRRTLSGRAFSYEAATSKERVLKSAIRELAEQMFGGSSEDLVMSLVKSRQVDAARIAELSRRIADEDEEEAPDA